MEKKTGWIIIGLTLIFLTVGIVHLVSNNDWEITGRVIEGTEAKEVVHKITVKDSGYSVDILKINIGETVAWGNFGETKHTVTSIDGNELNSQTLTIGEVYSHVFEKKGTFNYYCEFHPEIRGTVIVK